ncbi:putative fatty acyl-CoA reductase CG5065 isoform X2 [Diachasmimorpha longicaudata]|uniref:putative fatty acyl-CoA reductase CG5065 isoform X2 n=1 Tax=Diachasmimorpha longicaudata TaxID=58733 RepID=UPI0030B90510
MNIEKLSVIDFYNGKSILITGGTGDMGKLLVEKLLRCFPKLGCIYLLIRDKKATMASERLSTLLDSPVFDELRHCSPNIFSKVRIIEGDLCVSDLGLSKANQKILIEKVSIVFHCAANVRFNVPLEEAININLFGTRRLLELCHNMIQIEVFIHVSTLFSTCYKKTIEECIPFIPAINGVVDFTQNEDDVMKAIPPELVKNWPNTYTFSKALTEIMLKDLRGKIPVGIVRPSIIVSSLKEPMPGWINSFYGPTYMITNAALGILRTSICETNNTAHGIPSDMVINLLLCVAPKTKYEGVEKIEVYNFCTSRQNRLTVKLLFEETEKIFRMYPLMRAIRYPNHTLRTSEIIHAVVTAVQHRLFGYVFDLIALCTFRKPSLSRIYSSLSKHATNTKFFTLNDFTVFGHNVERLNADLSEREREIFYFDVKTLNWMSFLRDYALGIRKYLLKEDLMNLGEAVPRMKKYFLEFIGSRNSCSHSCPSHRFF